MADKEALDIKMYNISGKNVQKDVNAVIDLKLEVLTINENLFLLDTDLEQISKKLNLYVNNIVNLKKPYDCEEQFLYFDKNYIYILSGKDGSLILEELADSIENDENFDITLTIENTLGINKAKRSRYIINSKQIDKCIELTDQYNEILESQDELYSIMMYFESQLCEMLEDIKNKLETTLLYDITKTKEKIEKFNKNKHKILLTTDKEDNWKLVYVNNKDYNKILNDK